MPNETSGFVDLYWIPVGAGTRFQSLSLKLYEQVLATFAGRQPTTLLHAALKLGIGDQRFVLEVMPAGPGPEVLREDTGPVGLRGADRFRALRYHVRVFEGDALPDEEWAVAPPVRVTQDGASAELVLRLAKEVPKYTWGRRRPCQPEMWTSDSAVSWMLSRAELGAANILVPPGCRAPGWVSGIIEAATAQRTPAAVLR